MPMRSVALAHLFVVVMAGCSRPAVGTISDGAVVLDASAPLDATEAPPDEALALADAATPPPDAASVPLDATLVATADLSVPDLRVSDLRLPDLRPPPDLAVPSDLALVVDATIPSDLAMPADLRAPADQLTVDLRPACTPLVNEVQTGSSTSALEEFVEIYNPCPTAIDLSGWHLVYRSSANGSPRNGADSSTLYIFPDGGVIASQAYLVYGGSKFLGTKDDLLAASMADTGGGVGLRNAAATLVDSVGYGDATNAFIEKSVAPAHPVPFSPGRSIGRLPNGQDLDDNSLDFAILAATSPKLANQ